MSSSDNNSSGENINLINNIDPQSFIGYQGFQGFQGIITRLPGIPGI